MKIRNGIAPPDRVHLVVSVPLPETIGRLDTDEDMREFAIRYIAPLVHGVEGVAGD